MADAPATGRLRLIALDQVISGGSNVLASVIAARLLGPAAFGTFGIVFLIYALGQGVGRAGLGNTVLVHPVEARERRAEVLGAGLLLGVVLAVLIGLSGLIAHLFDSSLGLPLLLLAACMPLLMLQDLSRYLAFGWKPSIAILLDAVWLVLMVGAAVALSGLGQRNVTALVGAWAVPGALAGIVGLVCWKVWSPRLSRRWVVDTWDMSWRFVLSFAASQGSVLSAAFLVRGIAGGVALGAVNGTSLLTRPYTTVETAAVASAIGDVARSPRTRADVQAHVRRVTRLTFALGTANALVMVFLPDAVGVRVLGETWGHVHNLLLPFGLQLMCMGLNTGPRAGLVGLRAIEKTLVLDLIFMPSLLIVSLIGLLIGGTVGYSWAIVGAWALAVTAWWITYLRHAAAELPEAVADTTLIEPV
jgi:O-antigen/teichoic acid export membrane protein